MKISSKSAFAKMKGKQSSALGALEECKGAHTGLFSKKDGVGMIIGPDGQMHMSMKSGNVAFVDGKAYFGVGDNMALGSDGKAYFGVGNAVFGTDGSAHLKFGDNPTFLV